MPSAKPKKILITEKKIRGKKTSVFKITPKVTGYKSLKTIQPKNRPTLVITKNKARSPHVIDLKKVFFERELQKEKEKTYGEKLATHFFNTQEKATTKAEAAHNWITQLPQPKIEKKKSEFYIPKETQVLEYSLPIQQNLKPKKEFKKLQLPKIKLPSIKIPEISFNFLKNLEISSYAKKSFLYFTLTSFLLSSPLISYSYFQKTQVQKGKVLGIVSQGVQDLKSAKNSGLNGDLDMAQESLTNAYSAFLAANQELNQLPVFVEAVLPLLPQNKQFESVSTLINIARVTTAISADLTTVISSSSEIPFTTRLNTFLETLSVNEDELKNLSKEIQTIDISIIPENYQSYIKTLQKTLPKFSDLTQSINDYGDVLLKFLGGDETKRYLVLFQNNAEIRATGGFIGSYAVIDIADGKLKNLTIPHGGIYDLQGSLKANITPPNPISLLNPRWEIQDSNFFFDFPTSAKKVSDFYRLHGGTTIDGVIAIQPSILQKLISITGDITLNDYQITVNENNIIDIIQEIVEVGVDKDENKPKKILNDLADILINKIFTEKNIDFKALTQITLESLNQKEIQIFSFDSQVQETMNDLQWSGKIKETSGDYLAIVSTNIAGSKSNKVISDLVDVSTDISSSGTIIQTITLTRTHTGDPKNPLSGIKNNDYIRFYTPLGSRLISAQGFEPISADIYPQPTIQTEPDKDLSIIESTKKIETYSQTEIFEENSKTVFANWIQVEPQTKKTVTIKYEIPKGLNHETKETSWIEKVTNQDELKAYSLLIQKQTGVQRKFKVNITTDSKYNFIWSYPSTLEPHGKEYSTQEFDLEKDAFLGIVLK